MTVVLGLMILVILATVATWIHERPMQANLNECGAQLKMQQILESELQALRNLIDDEASLKDATVGVDRRRTYFHLESAQKLLQAISLQAGAENGLSIYAITSMLDVKEASKVLKRRQQLLVIAQDHITLAKDTRKNPLTGSGSYDPIVQLLDLFCIHQNQRSDEQLPAEQRLQFAFGAIGVKMITSQLTAREEKPLDYCVTIVRGVFHCMSWMQRGKRGLTGGCLTWALRIMRYGELCKHLEGRRSEFQNDLWQLQRMLFEILTRCMSECHEGPFAEYDAAFKNFEEKVLSRIGTLPHSI